jgi:hypothetical protein
MAKPTLASLNHVASRLRAAAASASATVLLDDREHAKTDVWHLFNEVNEALKEVTAVLSVVSPLNDKPGRRWTLHVYLGTVPDDAQKAAE